MKPPGKERASSGRGAAADVFEEALEGDSIPRLEVLRVCRVIRHGRCSPEEMPFLGDLEGREAGGQGGTAKACTDCHAKYR